MKMKTRKILSLLVVSALALVFFGCGDINNTVPKVTVTFMSHGQVVLGTWLVEPGSTIDRPFDPSRDDGWTFTNWFNQASGGAIFDFTAPITANTTIWARWTQTPRTVTFHLHGGSWGLGGNIAIVHHGDPVGMPTAEPARSGYLFEGWFDSATGGNKWNFDTPITDDITLWAQWSPAVRLTFDLVGGIWDTPPPM